MDTYVKETRNPTVVPDMDRVPIADGPHNLFTEEVSASQQTTPSPRRVATNRSREERRSGYVEIFNGFAPREMKIVNQRPTKLR